MRLVRTFGALAAGLILGGALAMAFTWASMGPMFFVGLAALVCGTLAALQYPLAARGASLDEAYAVGYEAGYRAGEKATRQPGSISQIDQRRRAGDW